jgi:uncharacterized protein YegJ (DUF2314 family)
MKRALNVALLLVSVIVLSLTACSKRDRVINVDDDDAKMNAAIAKARETLPHFWQVFEKPERGETDFALKVKITDGNRVEHFWAIDIAKPGGKIKGTINNDPNTVQTVKLGSRIEISEADISDWMYMRQGKMVGNQTLKPLLKQMPAAEANKYKSIMAEP